METNMGRMVNGDKREMGHSSSENETDDVENGMGAVKSTPNLHVPCCLN